ncbi:MAG: PEP-CTERM sorting domain-containing protein [Akkermansiaceae bacterium]
MKTKHTIAVISTLAAIATSASAASVGVNNSTAASLGDGWQGGDDTNVTGTPFGVWSHTTDTSGGGFAGFFIGSSTDLDGGVGANINASGSSFGIFGNGGGRADGLLDLGSALTVGQTFSFDIAVNFRNGDKGVEVRNGAAATIFKFAIDNDDHVVSDAATGNGSTGDSYSANTAFNLSFTQTSALAGSWTINRSGGITDSDSGTYTGAISSINLYNEADGGGDANNLYANNFTVVPEPSSAALLGLGGLALIMRRRK